GISEVVANTYNGVLNIVGGKLMDVSAVQTGNYGMRKKLFVYKLYSTNDSDAITARFDTAEDLIAYGSYIGLNDMAGQIAGGDVYVKRALHATLSSTTPATFAADVLLGNLVSAQDYSRYLQSSPAINALMAAEPDSAFTAGWVITMARAAEL